MQDRVKFLQQKLESFAHERDWAKFHSPKNLVMALSVEVGELVEIFQWLTEKESEELSEDQRINVNREIGDVQIYLLRLTDILNVDLFEAVEKKIEENEQKYPADKVRGSAKKYTEY